MNLVFSHREAATSNLNTAIHDSCFFLLFFLKKILFNEPTQKENSILAGWWCEEELVHRTDGCSIYACVPLRVVDSSTTTAEGVIYQCLGCSRKAWFSSRPFSPELLWRKWRRGIAMTRSCQSIFITWSKSLNEPRGNLRKEDDNRNSNPSRKTKQNNTESKIR